MSFRQAASSCVAKAVPEHLSNFRNGTGWGPRLCSVPPSLPKWLFPRCFPQVQVEAQADGFAGPESLSRIHALQHCQRAQTVQSKNKNVHKNLH